MTKVKQLTSELIDMYGITQAFVMMIVSFISNNPNILLIGDPGCGKTEMIKRLSAILEAFMNTKLFMADATTFDPEYNIGVPVPIVVNDSTKAAGFFNKFMTEFAKADEKEPLAKQVYRALKAMKGHKDNRETHIARIPNESGFLTAETVAIDEISRANLRAMNALLQLYSNNKVDGQPLRAMFKVAMMNDPSHAGSEELSSALAERFPIAYIMPNAGDMSKEDRALGTAEQPLIDNFWENHETAERGDWNPGDLRERGEFLVKELRKIKADYLDLRQSHKSIVTEYVDALCLSLEKETGIKVQFRRRQYLYDNILALHATMRAMNVDDIEGSAYTAIQVSFPGWLYGEPVKKESLMTAHEIAKRFLVNPEDRVIMELLDIQRDNVFMAAAEAIKRKVDPMHISKFINHALTSNEEQADKAAFATALLSMKNIKLQSNDLRLLFNTAKSGLEVIKEVA